MSAIVCSLRELVGARGSRRRALAGCGKETLPNACLAVALPPLSFPLTVAARPRSPHFLRLAHWNPPRLPQNPQPCGMPRADKSQQRSLPPLALSLAPTSLPPPPRLAATYQSPSLRQNTTPSPCPLRHPHPHPSIPRSRPTRRQWRQPLRLHAGLCPQRTPTRSPGEPRALATP